MTLISHIARVNQLEIHQRDEMFALMDRHYLNMSRDQFESDLADKKWVILVRESDRSPLCGFSTQSLIHMRHEGKEILALFSGDTIIDKDHWGNQALARAWGRLAVRLIDETKAGPLYWFLTSKGYKTYRFLPLFFHEFFPRVDRPTPHWVQKTIDALAHCKYPARYVATEGLIKPAAHSDRLRPGVADLTFPRLNDPHIRFFAERNPRHEMGDELCCLAPLTRPNFTPAAWRVIGEMDQPVEL